MSRFPFYLCLAALLFSSLAQARDLRIIAVIGAGGEDTYDQIFAETAEYWKGAAAKGEAIYEEIREGDSMTSDLEAAIKSASEAELWVVLIGHGSFDGRDAKFNVNGPDFTDADFSQWIGEYDGDLTVINTASASSSYIQRLTKPGRVIITATKSQSEFYFSRFGRYFAQAIAGEADADLDNDEQTSLLECFIYASDQVVTFYETEGRLATEHALIDDNGDGLGSRVEWFDGVNATETATPEAKPDGERANQKVLIQNRFERALTAEQRALRDRLETEVKKLRRNRDALDEAVYYERLEKLLLQLAEIYRDVEES